jgi:hypothetical protein
MNPDAVVVALIAIGDLALIVHLRRRNNIRVRFERMMASLYIAVRGPGNVQVMPPKRDLRRAS